MRLFLYVRLFYGRACEHYVEYDGNHDILLMQRTSRLHFHIFVNVVDTQRPQLIIYAYVVQETCRLTAFCSQLIFPAEI